MSKQTRQIKKPKSQRPSIQPKEEQEANNRAHTQAIKGLAPGAALQLPGRASQSLRQTAVIQMSPFMSPTAMSALLEEEGAIGSAAPPVPIPFPNKADMGSQAGSSSKVKFFQKGDKQDQATDTLKDMLIAPDSSDSQKEEDYD